MLDIAWASCSIMLVETDPKWPIPNSVACLTFPNLVAYRTFTLMIFFTVAGLYFAFPAALMRTFTL